MAANHMSGCCCGRHGTPKCCVVAEWPHHMPALSRTCDELQGTRVHVAVWAVSRAEDARSMLDVRCPAWPEDAHSCEPCTGPVNPVQAAIVPCMHHSTLDFLKPPRRASAFCFSTTSGDAWHCQSHMVAYRCPVCRPRHTWQLAGTPHTSGLISCWCLSKPNPTTLQDGVVGRWWLACTHFNVYTAGEVRPFDGISCVLTSRCYFSSCLMRCTEPESLTQRQPHHVEVACHASATCKLLVNINCPSTLAAATGPAAQ